jgi:heat shock protein beta
MFENYYQKPSGLKLYVRRVLISEKFEELMPRYLNFIKGVIDSDDLPINVSRETLQQLRMIKVMGKKVVRKALEMIKKLAESKHEDEEEEDSEYETESSEEVEKAEDKKEESSSDDEDAEKKKKEKVEKYNTFWKEFGKNLKLGIIEDASNRNRLAELTRWYSTHNSELTSFDDYIERMKDGQESIFFIGGESRELLLKSPNIQGLIKRGYEVLLLDDPVDEFCMQHLNEYEKNKLVNVGKGDFKMPSDDETDKRRMKKLKKLYEPLTEWWKKTLVDQLENVVVSDKLVDDPVVVVASSYGYSAYMEKIQKAQAYGNQSPQANSKKILEINPNHPVVKELLERVKDPREEADNETKELATLLYEAALLNSGFAISDTHSFSTRFFKIFNGALGVPKDAKVEEVQVDLDESSESDEAPKPHGDEVIEEINPEDIKVTHQNHDL